MNNNLKILSIIGTRPEAIKMYPLIKLLIKDKTIEHKICLSGQHEDLLINTLNSFGVEHHYILKVMSEGQPIDKLFYHPEIY